MATRHKRTTAAAPKLGSGSRYCRIVGYVDAAGLQIYSTFSYGVARGRARPGSGIGGTKASWYSCACRYFGVDRVERSTRRTWYGGYLIGRVPCPSGSRFGWCVADQPRLRSSYYVGPRCCVRAAVGVDSKSLWPVGRVNYWCRGGDFVLDGNTADALGCGIFYGLGIVVSCPARCHGITAQSTSPFQN